MKPLSKFVTALNTLTITLGLSHSTFALDPATLYQRSNAAVAAIAAPDGKSFGYGSGFITSPKGLILTSYHVVGNNSQVWVKLADNSVYRGVVISRNPQSDLALIQIQPKKQLPSLTVQTVPPRIGQKVYAIGNPKGFERSLSDGIVSRIDQRGLIQYTAPTTSGNSGGPLLDEDGRVIGVVRSTFPGTALNFAVPIAAMNTLSRQQGTAAQQLQQSQNYVVAGLLQMRQGNYQNALALFNAGIRRYPNHVILYSNRGVAKRYLRDYQGAIADFTRSIQLQPNSPAYFNRASLHKALKQPQRALSDYTEAIRVNQNWGDRTLGDALYNRGQVQAQLGDTKAAISDFKQAAKFFNQIRNTERYRDAIDQITLITSQ
ncbi:trypsin-like peptidase domain-containing protein [Cyanobacteria bacterium FACHB-63]|nr:trypsin-like peptidase domain-containing protein [Cyanobacteria bacterium FACHB-63]